MIIEILQIDIGQYLLYLNFRQLAYVTVLYEFLASVRDGVVHDERFAQK